ncbi:hypothetical protein L1049_009047 [Liquidambar formosana]|uniref:Uncharacterized protein n=1 Tax=Liquidambar formosana TaxID=63359 RepID=A0AAP0SBM5_LIQFO
MDGEISEKLLKKAGTEEDVFEEARLKDRMWNETKKIWVVAGPAIFTRFSTFGVNVISQAFVGHIGSTELAAYALVFTVLFRFANGILSQREIWPIPCSLRSILVFSLELWYNTVLILLTGNLKNAEVSIDALSICLNINGWEMMITLGFLAAARTCRVKTFSSTGVAVGAGWQSIVAYVNIACYYFVGIPIGVVLGYVINMQVKGVWIGMLFGVFVQTVVLVIITYRTDWDKQVSVAHKSINKWFVEKIEEPNPKAQNA